MEQETKQIQVERFEPKLEAKLIIKLNKILVAAEKPLTEENALKQDMAVMDPSNVTMVVAKTEEAKRVLARFINVESATKVPELEFNEPNRPCISKYSVLYLQPIIDIFNVFKGGYDSIKISMKADYPIVLENEHLKIILAPRLEND